MSSFARSFPTTHSGGGSATATGSIALEQASADLTLLQQSLTRSSKISGRMGHVLGELDDRLARLEKNLVPIYKETGRLNRVSKNLELTMRSIDGLLGHSDLVEREEGLIKAGPDPDDLKPYMTAIERLVAASEALRKTDLKGQSATLAQMGGLVELGVKQLVGVFSKWARETSPTVDAGKLFDRAKPFPVLTPFFLEHALPINAFLWSLPDPKGPGLAELLTSAYASIRAAYIDESLRNAAREVLSDATPTMVQQSPRPGAGAGGSSAAAAAADLAERRGLGRLLDVFFALIKTEFSLLETVLTAQAASTRSSLYASLLPPALATISSTGASLNGLIRKSPQHQLIPLAFATYIELSERAHEFEEWVRVKARRKENEVGDLTHQFRGTCMTSLPGILEETKVWGTRPPAGPEATSAAVQPVTINVVNFMRQLADNQPTAEAFLGTLGAGNWGGPSKGGVKEGDDGGLLQRYLNDVLSVLLTALDAKARLLRGRAGTSSIFLLNNLSCVRHSALSTSIIDTLGESAEDALNKRMRTLKASYLDVWSPLVSALLDAGFADQSGAAGALKAGLGAVKGGGGTERRETKDRFVRFHEALDDVEALHHQARFEEGEAELRERLKGEVERMVVPTYAKFVQRHRKDNYSSKYLKLDADGLEAKIRAIFDSPSS